ncbi:MAG: hypothetical protein DRP46_01915 [Candidatus Zixiibacteriota bacterium]|nr:MAG: hypothetical protein DRP46_01915 [candidate division Zixibacteria bacterium]HDL03881.1 hypothetical protein [candidate division Zixibacteria bacterium]
MRYSLLCLLVIAVIFACGDEYYGPEPDDGPVITAIETEPSLSPDGNYIYYISSDTTDEYYSGIFRISVSTLIRRKLVHGTGYHSPTAGFNNSMIAFLDSGRVNYFSLIDLSRRTSSLSESFISISYIRDSILLGYRTDSLFLISDSGEVSPLPVTGWDPRVISEDVFIYFTGKSPEFYAVMNNIFVVDPDTLLALNTSARPSWPTLTRTYNQLAYDVSAGSRREIYTAQLGGDSPLLIANSQYSKSLYLEDGRLIFTGSSGSFYYSDYTGANPQPLVP